MEYIEKLTKALATQRAFDEKIRVKVDTRNKDSVDKYWEWARKGAPVICEIGMRDVESEKIMCKIRHLIGTKEAKKLLSFSEFSQNMGSLLESIQQEMFSKAKTRMENNIKKDIKDFAEFKSYFKDKSSFIESGKKNVPAFVLAKWSKDEESIALIKELGVTVRCIPFDYQDGKEGTCVLTGKPATEYAVFARAY